MRDSIEFSRFRRLLQSLENSDTHIRLRVSGENWMDFSTVILLSDSAMIVQNGTNQRMIMNLRNIVEFELEKPVAGLGAPGPYEIIH